MSAAIRALQRRNLIADSTHKNLESILDSSIGKSVYCGFDPTAKSLHLGNLIQILALGRFQACGFQPIILMGGATGRIGDPSGKSDERVLLDESALENNMNNMFAKLQQYFHQGQQAELLNNYDWHGKMTSIDLLREAGRHFRVNTMMTKESVKRRLQSTQGISFLEFSYPLFQAYDFLYLHQHKNCILQIGGSDQWGNITAGCDLVRKSMATEVFGLTIPLLTTSSGEKFGKSEGNAIWLDESMTSCYDFYQYFMRAEDTDVKQLLYTFTNLEEDDIDQLVIEHERALELHGAQRTLAESQTSADQILESVQDAPRVLHSPLVNVVVQSNACKSKAQVRRLVAAGGLYINNKRCPNDKVMIEETEMY